MFSIKTLRLFLCVVAVWASQQDQIKVKPLEDRIGTLLITEGPIAFTSLTWRLVFEWDLAPLEETLHLLQDISYNLTKLNVSRVEQQAILHAKDALATAEADFNSFKNLVRGTTEWSNQTERFHEEKLRRRDTTAPDNMKLAKGRTPSLPEKVATDAWRGSAGSIMSSVFGVASEEELDNVHELLDTLFRREAKMVTIQRFHITTIKKMQSQIDIQQEQLDRIVNFTAGVYHMYLQKPLSQSETYFNGILAHHDLINAIGYFKTTVLNHRQVLNSLDRGYIDSDLVSTKILQDTLVKIRDSIPTGFKLVFDPLQTNLHPYYTSKLASRLTGSDNIRGLLQIPHTGLTDNFVLYKSVPFPSSFGPGSTRRFILKDSSCYIALSADRKQFLDLRTVFNPMQCLQGPTLVCPATTSVLTSPATNCIFHLITGHLKLGTDQTKCQMAEVATEDTYIQGIDTEEWVVSAPHPVMVHSTCIDLNASTTPMVTSPGKNIKGDQLLHIPRFCTVAIDHHTIPMRLLLTTKLGRLPTRLSLPTLHTHQLLNLHGAQILDDKLTKELNVAIKNLVLFNHKKSLLVNASSQEVQQAVSKMTFATDEIAKIQPTFHYHGISWGLIVFLFVVGTCVMLWIVRKFRTPLRTTDVATYIVAPDGTRTNPARVDIMAAATNK